MGYIDLKISRIRAYNRVNGRRERMKKLVAVKPASPKDKKGIKKTKYDYMNRELEEATKEGNVEAFLMTLEKVSVEKKWPLEAIFEQKDYNGNTYLHVAAMLGHHEIVGLMLSVSEIRDLFGQRNAEGDTAMHKAAKAGHVAVADLLKRHDNETFEDVTEQTNNKGNSPLHEALIHDHQSMVDLLLHFGAWSSCYLNNEGKSAFYLAVEAGNVKSFNAMWEAECSRTDERLEFEEQFMKGKSMLHAADAFRSSEWDSRHERMTKLLKTCPIQSLPQQDMSYQCMDLGLYEAAKKGNVDDFISALEKFSLEQNLDLPTIFNQCTPLRNTYLHVACRSRGKDLSRLSIQYFPDLLNRGNRDGNTVLHLAARHEHLIESRHESI